VSLADYKVVPHTHTHTHTHTPNPPPPTHTQHTHTHTHIYPCTYTYTHVDREVVPIGEGLHDLTRPRVPHPILQIFTSL
jgi:hypothetical protein